MRLTNILKRIINPVWKESKVADLVILDRNLMKVDKMDIRYIQIFEDYLKSFIQLMFGHSIRHTKYSLHNREYFYYFSVYYKGSISKKL